MNRLYHGTINSIEPTFGIFVEDIKLLYKGYLGKASIKNPSSFYY